MDDAQNLAVLEERLKATSTEVKDAKERLEGVERQLRDARTVMLVLGIVGLIGGGFVGYAYKSIMKVAETKDAFIETIKKESLAAEQNVQDSQAAAVRKIAETTQVAEESVRKALQEYLASSTLVRKVGRLEGRQVVFAFTPEMSWSQGQPAVSLGVKSGEGVCFLTRITGKFMGGGEAVIISHTESGFVLTGSSQMHSVAASARCLKLMNNSST